MRLWSLHPSYLDPAGLVACWREGLLARAVLAGQTKGYKNHPQLDRFKAARAPLAAVDTYLAAICDEADRRGYRFDRSKLGTARVRKPLTVTRGQLAFELAHLTKKVRERRPEWLAQMPDGRKPAPHPMFVAVAGGIEAWERVP
ncbi:MAG TPA: pyrimidine dimer DNA glycosylase/endonuclease V [Gemmatimonadaceae bacterium]|nr:pyrimidine dimer DNA glycosylase/endonuclease V [Gemmatimonadaceae bacterium]